MGSTGGAPVHQELVDLAIHWAGAFIVYFEPRYPQLLPKARAVRLFDAPPGAVEFDFVPVSPFSH